MSIQPGAVDMRSAKALRAAFRSAPEPTVDDLVGEFRSEYIGPGWLRAVAPATMRLGRMHGWCGKRFARSELGNPPLSGVNLVRSGAVVSDSVPMVADLGPSRIDGRASLIIGYPIDAPFPWPRVIDELRPFGESALLGMTFGIPGSLPGGTPFLLHRTPLGQGSGAAATS
jgi:hypothetical protein